jgi:hypothetical protein
VLRALAGKTWAPNNRGVVLDLAVFFVALFLARALVALAHAAVQAAAREDMHAKLAVGLFFAVLVLIQPIGPALKRWSFHQRHTFSAESGAGCLVFWFMFVYFAVMLALCTTAIVVLGEVFANGAGANESVGVGLVLAGFVWSMFSVGIVYRYFMTPKKPPRWTFLTTPAAEHLGDAFVFANAIGFQILWGSVTSSGMFREAVTGTPLGRPGSASDVLGRLLAIAACALVLYLPARIYYLAEDKHRALTYATMLLANFPLILTLAFAPSAHI